ncbi:MAG: flagellar hook basal-body protein [Myxococcota bacterium]|nr:flagellar hook basal-body protein [Myxococcota bacterium]
MSKEFYPPVSAAMATWRQLEHISNNLSNANTAGFKEERVSFENVLSAQGPLGDSFVKSTGSHSNFESGNVVQDGVDTHFALQGDGFFVVENADGEQMLQRAGLFQLDNQGFLINNMNELVLGENGPIRVLEDQRIQITPDGQILDQDNVPLGRLLLATADEFEPIAATRWKATNIRQLSEEDSPTVIQGAFESSNVDTFRSMMELIESSRFYESFQKIIQAADSMDGQLNSTTKRSG